MLGNSVAYEERTVPRTSDSEILGLFRPLHFGLLSKPLLLPFLLASLGKHKKELKENKFESPYWGCSYFRCPYVVVRSFMLVEHDVSF